MNWWDTIVAITAIAYAVGSFFGIIWILYHVGLIKIEWKDR